MFNDTVLFVIVVVAVVLVVFALLVGRWLTSGRWPTRGAILISLYVVFLIAFFEGSARLAFWIPQVSRRLSADESLTWRRLWIEGHQKTGMNMNYKSDIYDPSKGWISKPHLRDMEVFDDKVLNTNSKGLRGKAEYSYSKDRGKVRILILGDSFTFGEEVSDTETYPYYVQELIPSVEVINLGVHGYGHDQMLILLQEEGIKYEPDMIILGFLPGDMHRNLLNFRDYAKPKFVIDNQKLRLTGSPVPTPEETIKRDYARPRIVDVVSLIQYRLKQWITPKEEEDLTIAILTEIINVAEGIQAVPIFVYLPNGLDDPIFAHRPNGRDISVRAPLTSGEKYLFGVCQTDHRVKCLSTRPHFEEKMNDGATIAPQKHGHWGPAGNRVIAEAITRYLVDEGYVRLRDNGERSNITKPNRTLEQRDKLHSNSVQ
jgi:hypothetical protein